jgi:hypothetical protein
LEGVSFEATEETDLDLEAIRNMMLTSGNEYNSNVSLGSDDDSQELLEASDRLDQFATSGGKPRAFPGANYLQSIYGAKQQGEEGGESDRQVDDEWENDDDTGYVVISISSDDFFEMEEVGDLPLR